MFTLRKCPSVHLCVLVFCIFFISLTVFWPGVSGGFLFDDYHNIVSNAHIQISDLTSVNLWRAANAYSDGTRQLPMLTFALNAYWAGLNPWAYKVTGLLAHAVNAVLVFLLVRRIFAFTAAIPARHRNAVAGALALIWALHPLQVSSALYIVQRMETMCYGFLLVALLLYLYAREQQLANGRSHWALWAGMALAWLAAWLCKENAALLPLFCLALEASVLQSGPISPARRRFWRSLCIGGSAVAVLVFTLWAWPHYYTAEPYPGRDFNTTQRLLTQSRVLWMYVQQMLLPLPQTMYFYYDDLPLSTGWLQPMSTLWCVLALVAIFVLAVLGRRRYPLFALGVFWFFASHFLTSNIVGLELMFEHRNYFALLAVLLACAEGIARLPVRDGPAIKYAGIAVLVVGIGFLGGVRAATWGNVLLLATDMAGKNPQSARAGMDLGVAYYELSGGDSQSPFYQFAASQFDRVAVLPNASTQADVNLILMSAGGGLPVDLVNVEAIWQRYLQRLQTLHLSVETRTSVWSLLAERMKGKAIDDRHLEQALAIIMKREDQQDYRLAQVADYYLRILNNEKMAKTLYVDAIHEAQKNGNKPLIDAIVGSVFDAGSPHLAAQLALMQK